MPSAAPEAPACLLCPSSAGPSTPSQGLGSKMEVKVTQSESDSCDPVDYPVHGTLQEQEHWGGQPFPSPKSSRTQSLRPGGVFTS